MKDKTLQCGTNQTFSNGMLTTFPSEILAGVSKLTVDVVFTITDMCSETYPNDLFILTIKPPGSSQRKLIAHTYSGAASVTTSTETSANVVTFTQFTATSNIGVGSSFEFWNSIDFVNNQVSYTNILPGFQGGNDYTSGDYAGWEIDSSTTFYICSDVLGSIKFTCQIYSLAVWYTYKTTLTSYPYLWGIYPTLLGVWTFADGSGTTIQDSVGGIGSVLLDSNSPIWSSTDKTVEFTASNQYLTLQNFPIAQSTPLTTNSLTLSFWIKVSAYSVGYIFRYSSSTLAVDRISLILLSDGTLQANLGGSLTPLTTTLSIPLSTWSMITATFIVSSISGLGSISIYIDSNLAGTNGNFWMAVYPLSITATDIVRVGGPSTFLGKITNLKIYSPGSAFVAATTCASITTCSIFLGSHSAYSNDCLSCPNATDPFCSDCMQCPDGKYYDTYQCLSCPSLCSTCTNSTTCQTCQLGYSLENSFCYYPTATKAYADEVAKEKHDHDETEFKARSIIWGIIGALLGGTLVAFLIRAYLKFIWRKRNIDDNEEESEVELEHMSHFEENFSEPPYKI